MKENIKYGVSQTLPLLPGFLALGIAYGLAMQQAGFGMFWPAVVSLVADAGSMQFVMISFLKGGVGLLEAALVTLSVNFRHVFYGLSFLQKYREMGKAYPYMIFSLTDETYSLQCNLKVPEGLDEKQVRLFLSISNHCYWVTGSLLGSLIGEMITFDITGIDFSMTALFVTIFVEQWREAKTHLPAIIGLICGGVFLFLLGPDGFLLPALVCSVMVLIFGKPVILRQEREGRKRA